MSSGERKRRSPNRFCYGKVGVVGLSIRNRFNLNELGNSAIEGDSPVRVQNEDVRVSWVGGSWWNSLWICRHHPVRLNTNKRPIVNEYCEGKVKRTPSRGVKRPWNHTLTSGRSSAMLWRRAFCIMTLRVTLPGKIKDLRSGVGAKASLKRAFSQGE